MASQTVYKTTVDKVGRKKIVNTKAAKKQAKPNQTVAKGGDTPAEGDK